MDQNYNYRSDYSGQNITGKSLSRVYSILCDLDSKGLLAKGTKGGEGFGLGCVQWTFTRTKSLVEKYREVAGSSDTLTLDQVMKAESLFIASEFNGSYHWVYNNWKNSCGSPNSVSAANTAGRIICTQYEVPNGYLSKQYQRGDMAAKIYAACVGDTPAPVPDPVVWTHIDADYRLTVQNSLPLRSSYSTSSSKLADMPAESVVHVIENGVHNGGYTWAHITWNGGLL